MPFLTRSLIVYNGSDSLPANDYSDATDWEETELSSMASDGDASAGSWLLRDEGGLIPDYKVPTYLSAHSVVRVTVGSNSLFRGRIAAHEQFRGRQKAGRANEVTVTLEDQNSHLRGMVVHNWVRGAETDAARVQGLVASYLSGSPRVTTNLNGSNYVITGSNAITQPAKTYSGVTPYEIMQELAAATNKQFFVTIDNELAYFGNDYTGYASQLRISDDPADANSTTYAPWDPRSSIVDREVLSAIRSYYGTDPITQTYAVAYPGVESFYDYWEGILWDSTSTTASQAAVVAAAEAAYRRSADATFTCSIGPMSGDEIYKIKSGQTIQVKARAARGGRTVAGVFSGDSFATGRIGELRWTMPAPDVYIAHLSLDNRKRARGGNQALATVPDANPNNPPVVVDPSSTLVKFYDANDGGDDIQWVGILTNQAGGAEGSAFYYFKSSAPNNFQSSFSATAGTTYTITGYTHIGAGNSLRIAWRNDAAGQGGAINDTNPVIIRIDTLASGTTSKWTSFSQTLVAPTGTTSASLGRGGSSADFDRIRIYTVAGGSSSGGGSVAQSQTDWGQGANPGSSTLYSRADHTHGTPPRPERTEIQLLTNNSGLNADWGDVVVADTTMDAAFTFNTTNAYSSGWVGVAQEPIGSNSIGPVLLAGYTPIINVGSNSTARGYFLYGSNMARRAYGSNTRTTGAFGQVLTTSVAPDAIIWGTSDNQGAAGGGVASAPVPWVLDTHSGQQQVGIETVGAANRGLVVPATLIAAATLTGIRYRVGTSSGNISVALYDSNLNRLATSGSVACPASGFATTNFTASYAAPAGRYYLGLSCSNNTGTFVMAQPSTAFGAVSGSFMETAHPLPTTFTSAGAARTLALAGILSGGWTGP